MCSSVRCTPRGWADIVTVPNHMGIVGNDNAWWNDVLENGPSSPYAGYFDIGWQEDCCGLNSDIRRPAADPGRAVRPGPGGPEDTPGLLCRGLHAALTAAIRRWLVPVAYQNFPPELLPPGLR